MNFSPCFFFFLEKRKKKEKESYQFIKVEVKILFHDQMLNISEASLASSI